MQYRLLLNLWTICTANELLLFQFFFFFIVLFNIQLIFVISVQIIIFHFSLISDCTTKILFLIYFFPLNLYCNDFKHFSLFCLLLLNLFHNRLLSKHFINKFSLFTVIVTTDGRYKASGGTEREWCRPCSTKMPR